MTQPAVFTAGPGFPFTDEFQEVIRAKMEQGIPKELKPRPDYRQECNIGNARKAALAAERRASLAPEIIRMFARGVSKRVIGRDLGVSDFYVSRVLREAGERHTDRRAA